MLCIVNIFLFQTSFFLQVFSSASFPGREQYVPFEPVFGLETKLQMNFSPQIYQPVPYNDDKLKVKRLFMKFSYVIFILFGFF